MNILRYLVSGGVGPTTPRPPTRLRCAYRLSDSSGGLAPWTPLTLNISLTCICLDSAEI